MGTWDMFILNVPFIFPFRSGVEPSPLLLRPMLAYCTMMSVAQSVECLVEETEVPVCPPQIPYGVTRARTRAATVAIQRLAAQATAWPKCSLYRISELMRVTFYSRFKHRPCQYLNLTIAIGPNIISMRAGAYLAIHFIFHKM
jgi:hypothetical protein